MKRILIDLSALGANNQNAILGIKYFLSKNKEDELTVIGDSNYTVTIHNNKRIIIAQTDMDNIKRDPEFNDIKDKNAQLLLTLLKTEKFNSFVTFSSLEELKPYINKYFVKKTSPLLMCSYANYKTHRCTIIGDIGYNFKPSSSDICNNLRSLKEYAKNIYQFKTTKFKIIKSNVVSEKEFQNDSDFDGVLETNKLYEANTDIVISDSLTCTNAMKAVEGAINVYDNFIKDEIKKSAGLRYFVYPMFRSVITHFHMNIDQKFTSGGITLLGYDKKIVFVNKDTIAMGVKAAIDNCAKF